jgi:DNA processing protein
VTAALDGRRVAAATLASLPGITVARLDGLLARHGDPETALAALRAGDRPDWVREVPDAPLSILRARGTRVWIRGDDDDPIRDEVPDRPAVLLGEGARPEALERPRVAIVGTRAATPHGLADARELGAYLADAGFTIVSGLAIGIDGAAHEGALDVDGTVVGVVATGLDVVYPRRHAQLFARARESGLVVGEHGYGVGPEAWRFPVRNRIIAALADAVVVVEATVTGGTRSTVDRAIEYGRPVLAVPGSRRNPAAAGCNALLAEGATPLLEPTDVLVALELSRGRRGWAPVVRPPDADGAALLRALAGEPATLDQAGARAGLAPARLAGAARSLERAGRLTRRHGLLWPL